MQQLNIFTERMISLQQSLQSETVLMRLFHSVGRMEFHPPADTGFDYI